MTIGRMVLAGALVVACGSQGTGKENNVANDQTGDEEETSKAAKPADDAGGGGGGEREAAAETVELPEGDPGEQYAAFLGDRKKEGAEVTEAAKYRVGDWRFFYQSYKSPAGRKEKGDSAAADGKGHVVTRGKTAGTGAWHAFLSSEELDPSGALERIAWLFEARPVSKAGNHKKIRDAEAAAVVTDPILEREGDRARFRGWLARPPSFSPFRVTIEAEPGQPASVETTAWGDVGGSE